MGEDREAHSVAVTYWGGIDIDYLNWKSCWDIMNHGVRNQQQLSRTRQRLGSLLTSTAGLFSSSMVLVDDPPQAEHSWHLGIIMKRLKCWPILCSRISLVSLLYLTEYLTQL